MCYAKPGPRCSGHARAARKAAAEKLQKLRDQEQSEEVMSAKKRDELQKKLVKAKRDYKLAYRDYSLTPDGANELRNGIIKKYTPILGEDQATVMAEETHQKLMNKRQEMVDAFNAMKEKKGTSNKTQSSRFSLNREGATKYEVLDEKKRILVNGLTKEEAESYIAQREKIEAAQQRDKEMRKPNPYSPTEYYGPSEIRDEIRVRDSDGYGTDYTRIDYDKGVYPSEPYSFRIQVGREISPEEARSLAGLVGYQYAQTGGERGNDYIQDTPNSIVFHADTTKGRAYRKLDTFVSELPATIQEGSPIRKTDRAGAGTQGTRKVEGMGDIGYVELYADYITKD